MYAPERHQAILDLARERGRVEVRDLAEQLEVTPETIRRDLTSLERRGLVRRAHGGAVPIERASLGAPGARETVNAAEKDAIAAAALAEVPEHGSILIDAGTTTLRLAELIPAGGSLTVVTHSLPVAMTLAGRPGIELHVLGGRLEANGTTVGTWTHQALGMVAVDVAFLSIEGITPERGFTVADLAEAAVKSAVIRASRRTIVLADHTKFGREEFARIAPLAAVDTIITDSAVNTELAGEVEAAGTTVVRALAAAPGLAVTATN